jgi:hypothetical protein
MVPSRNLRNKVIREIWRRIAATSSVNEFSGLVTVLSRIGFTCPQNTPESILQVKAEMAKISHKPPIN